MNTNMNTNMNTTLEANEVEVSTPRYDQLLEQERMLFEVLRGEYGVIPRSLWDSLILAIPDSAEKWTLVPPAK